MHQSKTFPHTKPTVGGITGSVRIEPTFLLYHEALDHIQPMKAFLAMSQTECIIVGTYDCDLHVKR